MLKTKTEKNYADIVLTMIMNSADSIEKKERKIKTFFNNQSYYYDNLCDNIYSMIVMKGTNVLTVDELGNSYVNLENRRADKKYYDVLVLNEFSPLCGDVIVLIELALNHLYDLTRAELTY